tara:strand:- start:747 stop:935 length:189 start_codon:yes stop_codon:yes gene_type:complete
MTVKEIVDEQIQTVEIVYIIVLWYVLYGIGLNIIYDVHVPHERCRCNTYIPYHYDYENKRKI